MGDSTPRRLVLEARAKVNLSLDITGSRGDGYHLVRMVLQTVDLADRLTLEVVDGADGPRPDVPFIRVVADDPTVPTGPSNLVARAGVVLARLVADKGVVGGGAVGAGVADDGVRTARLVPVLARLSKRIPVGAGLGGGSADAAAALLGLCRLWDLAPGHDELLAAGLEIGADVPFCLEGGTRLVEGIGERLRPIRRVRPYWLVLANPGFPVSTGRVYAEFNVLKAMDADVRRPENEKLVDAIEAGSGAAELGAFMANVLEPATLRLYPELGGLRDKLGEVGLHGVMMSGSGPTWIGLAEDQTHATRSAAWLRGRLPRGIRVFACVTAEQGVVTKSDAAKSDATKSDAGG